MTSKNSRFSRMRKAYSFALCDMWRPDGKCHNLKCRKRERKFKRIDVPIPNHPNPFEFLICLDCAIKLETMKQPELELIAEHQLYQFGVFSVVGKTVQQMDDLPQIEPELVPMMPPLKPTVER